MSYYEFTEVETLVWNFLHDINMCCNPDKWKEGYKEFIKYCKRKISYTEFEDTLLEFRNYYYCIGYDYNYETKEFGKFHFSKTYKPKLFDLKE